MGALPYWDLQFEACYSEHVTSGSWGHSLGLEFARAERSDNAVAP